MNTRFVVVAAAALVASVGVAQGAFVTVNLSAGINADVRTYTNGGFYPTGGQTLDFAGVPFDLGLRFDDPNSLGVVQTNGVGQAEVVSFAVSITNAARLYTLINSGFGALGAYNGRVDVFGTNGVSAFFELVQGVNIRDHFNGFYQNTITDPSVVPTNFGGDVRLDRQVLELPVEFQTETVTELRFTGGPLNSFVEGVAFLAGATFEQAVPTPGAVAIGSLGLMVMSRRRRR